METHGASACFAAFREPLARRLAPLRGMHARAVEFRTEFSLGFAMGQVGAWGLVGVGGVCRLLAVIGCGAGRFLCPSRGRNGSALGSTGCAALHPWLQSDAPSELEETCAAHMATAGFRCRDGDGLGGLGACRRNSRRQGIRRVGGEMTRVEDMATPATGVAMIFALI